MKFQFQLCPALRGLDLHAVVADVGRQWPEFASDRCHIITVDDGEPDDRTLKIDFLLDDVGFTAIPAIPRSEPWDTKPEPFDDDAWLSGFVRKDDDDSTGDK
jgi:hypothetical protein